METKLTEDGERLGRDESQGAYTRFANAGEVSVTRILRTAAEIFGPRGDDKNGSRSEWLAYVESMQNVKSKFAHTEQTDLTICLRMPRHLSFTNSISLNF
ncbi:hypothetical protein ElyMa_005100400 [Elysia marginata]|uniref:Uncharacterized protein n=1 Tax=Elysia marginata TaxID=1093978 RepID=A0AAV4JIL2_9GAST|nr:hypothetical protein ElyMa_005100400 [Elysia marginata]